MKKGEENWEAKQTEHLIDRTFYRQNILQTEHLIAEHLIAEHLIDRTFHRQNNSQT